MNLSSSFSEGAFIAKILSFLLVFVTVDDVEESFLGVSCRQHPLWVVGPKGHGLLITPCQGGEFALEREVVCGMRRNQVGARNGTHTLVFVPFSFHKELAWPTRAQGVLEDALDPSEGFFDRGCARRVALVVHAEDAVIFGGSACLILHVEGVPSKHRRLEFLA
jgi:hypothetical protein